MIFGHRTEILISVGFEICTSRKYPYPPPHPPQKTLWFAPPRPGFSIPGGLSWPPPPRRFETGTSLNTLWKWTPPPLRFPMIIHWGEGGVWIFYVILRLPCTCQWTVDSIIGKSGFCSKSQNPKVDFNNVFSSKKSKSGFHGFHL